MYTNQTIDARNVPWNHLRLLLGLALVAAIALFSSGCSKLVLKKVSKSLGGGPNTFALDNDPELVAEALPFALKTMESLVQAAPENDALLLATGSAYTMYAYAFIQFRADTLPDERQGERRVLLGRAKNLYMRAHDYLLRAFGVRYPGFSRALNEGDVDSLLAQTSRADTALLYWTGASWMGAFTTDKFDMALAVEVPHAVAMVRRSLELDDTYGRGAAHDFFISYYGSMPASMGGSVEKAHQHFQRSIEMGVPKAGPYVSLATSVCIPAQDINEFRSLLEKALSIDIDAAPSDRLANVLNQRKARWLLNNIDDFFLVADNETQEEDDTP